MLLSDPQDRYRQRATQRLVSVVCFIGMMVFSGITGFWIGGINSDRVEETLRRENEGLRQQIGDMQEVANQIRAEAQTANMRFDQLQKTYQEAVPEGPMQDLVTLIREQLAEGMDPKRLEFALRSARPPRNCTDPETKRFVISTPAYKGADSEISLADGAIKITATGTSAKNDKGNTEAWYDPTKAVNLVFTTSGGKVEKKSGVFPLEQTVVLEEQKKQYRFTVSEGARSFARVTFDSCDYP